MTPQHHLPDGLLLGYVSGAASDAQALVAAAHLSCCAACRDEAGRQEEVAAHFLEQEALLDEGGVDDHLLAAMLARLPARTPAPAGPRTSTGEGRWPMGRDRPRLPAVLAQRLAAAARAEWTFLAPGIKGVDLPTSTRGARLRLLRLAPGIRIPGHGHGGDEYTLVLEGAFTDDRALTFARGDLCLQEAGQAHAQRVPWSEPCIALQLNEGALLPLTWKGRVLAALFDSPFPSAS